MSKAVGCAVISTRDTRLGVLSDIDDLPIIDPAASDFIVATVPEPTEAEDIADSERLASLTVLCLRISACANVIRWF